MNLKHLELFLGTSNQMLDIYIIRCTGSSIVQFITLNGYVMCENTYRIDHDLTGQVFAISPTEFQKILMFEDQIIGFTTQDNELIMQTDYVSIPVTRLSGNLIPDLDKIFILKPVKDSDKLSFTPKNFKLIIDYCKRMNSTEFNVALTGDKLPMIISDQNWSIYIMPLGD